MTCKRGIRHSLEVHQLSDLNQHTDLDGGTDLTSAVRLSEASLDKTAAGIHPVTRIYITGILRTPLLSCDRKLLRTIFNPK